MLKISQAYLDEMIKHAREDFPDEACGVIIGPEDTRDLARLVRITNAERSPTYFRFDPDERLQLSNEMFPLDQEVLVVYHSHTSTEAYPSRTDISEAYEPQAHYVIVSLEESGREEGPVSVRAYRILDGDVTEEEITIRE
ncbi:Mov34/MPN/PAD-1 family protein [Microlunatus speluncae]|uniref:Mov34/MPN/PAD-1 family protein n=1 Tax=Microlunatus speluncae TaxID=2594267 RepID=UPI00126646EE|nr:M67 family metallopeptidase [Microlunatus speluncae]